MKNGDFDHAQYEKVKEYIGFPCVVKPTNQCASRGVTIAYHMHELITAVAKAFRYSNDILCEQYLEGTEHNAEIIFHSTYMNISDRYFSLVPGVALEVGHLNPTKLPPHRITQIITMMSQTANALGVDWGAFKCDVLVPYEDGEIPKILECTTRLSGGFDSTHTVPLARGVYPVQTMIEVATGQEASFIKNRLGPTMYAACAAMWPLPGKVIGLPTKDLKELKTRLRYEHDCLMDVYILLNKGDVIERYENCAQRKGFVLTCSEDSHKAWAMAIAHAQNISEMIKTEKVNI